MPPESPRETNGVDLLMIANRLLGSSGYPALRHVCCGFADGVLVLSGEVPTFYLKQVAQAVLLGSHSIPAIINHLQVCDRT